MLPLRAVCGDGTGFAFGNRAAKYLASGRAALLVRVRQGLPDGPASTPAPLAKAKAKATVVKFPCGHIFKYSCAVQWLEHQSSCPTCRQEVGRVVRLCYKPESLSTLEEREIAKKDEYE